MKKKVIVSIIIMLLILIIMSISSFAFEWAPYPEHETDQGYIYQCILYKSSDPDYPIQLVKTKGPMYYKSGSLYSSASGDMYKYKFLNDTEEWGSRHNIPTFGLLNSEILYSNHDIYLGSSLQDVFFSDTHPIPMPPIQETLTQHSPLTLMKSHLVGLIPSLIGLLIVSVGFYKGLSVLYKALRQA